MEGSTLPAAPGLPPKPTAAALDSALVSGNSGGGGGGGNRRRNTGGGNTGPPPPPPPDAKEDPRAAAGKRVSYHDMDLVAEVSFILLQLHGIFKTSLLMWLCSFFNREMLNYFTRFQGMSLGFL